MKIRRAFHKGAAGGGGGTAPDPNYANVSALLHFDGANGSTVIVDNSPGPVGNWTVTNAAAISTAQSKFGGACAFPNTGAYVSPISSAFTVGTGDFTVEGFWYFTRTDAIQWFFAGESSTYGYLDLGFYPAIPGLRLYVNNVTISGPAYTFNLSQWYHVAVVRISGVVSIYINGVFYVSATNGANLPSTRMYIGQQAPPAANLQFFGYVDEFRFTKGVGRYTANFTPPSAAFSNS
jgi:hypothetical protein